MKHRIRIAILWTELSGYLNACMKALVELYDVELSVVRISPEGASQYQYDERMFNWIPELHTLPHGSLDQVPRLLTRLLRFGPQVVVVSGWAQPAYRHIARELRARNVHVIGAIDNRWLCTFRQRIGVLISKWYVQPLFDSLWVPGERGTVFARKLGFSGSHLMEGLYTGDTDIFHKVAVWRAEQNRSEWPRRFLYAGRFSTEKGIEDLLAAYRNYRQRTTDPWELWLAGSGPLSHLLEEVDGVRNCGFVQPRDYPDILQQVGVFILPSHFEPWGVVIHEMATAGLPILCSRQCGSSVELVQDGYNGYLFEARDVEGMAELMIHVTTDSTNLPMMGQRSAQLSTRYSPEQWAHYLMSYLSRRGIRN